MYHTFVNIPIDIVFTHVLGLNKHDTHEYTFLEGNVYQMTSV